MNEQQITQLIDKRIADARRESLYGTTNPTYHTHNNIDSPIIPFTALGGVPNNYTSKAGKALIVNSTATGLTFGGKIGTTGSLFDHYTSVGNVTTGETDLYSDTIVSGTLASNGDKLEIEYGGIFVSSGTATREIKIYFGGTMIFDTGTLTLSLSSAWTAYVLIIRVSTLVVRYMISFTTEGAALAAYTNVGELTTATTLTSGINNSTTTIPVTSGTGLSNGDYIQIDSEILLITAGGGTATLTATRGQSSTAVASHSNGATVTRVISISPNILKITGQASGVGAATNDIVAKLGDVILIGAA